MPLSKLVLTYVWRWLWTLLDRVWRDWYDPPPPLTSNCPLSLRPFQLKQLGIGTDPPTTMRVEPSTQSWTIDSLPRANEKTCLNTSEDFFEPDTEISSAPIALRPQDLRVFLDAYAYAGPSN